MDEGAIRAWIAILDEVTYYTLLGTHAAASPDELKQAFHVFAETFHPDCQTGRPQAERDAIGRIFRRGTEAYRVVSNPILRAQYDASLAEGMPPSIASRKSSLPPAMERPAAPKTLADALRSPAARPFARRAEELVKAGDYKQAKLQLTMARHHEPQNEALEAFLKTVEAKLRAK